MFNFSRFWTADARASAAAAEGARTRASDAGPWWSLQGRPSSSGGVPREPCSRSAGGLCRGIGRPERYTSICSRPQRTNAEDPLLLLYQSEHALFGRVLPKIRFMYEPLVSTLIAGASAASPPWKVFHGICAANTF